jgi:hypothetical protein
VLIVHSALQRFLDCPDFVHATLSAYDDRSPPQDTLAKIDSPAMAVKKARKNSKACSARKALKATVPGRGHPGPSLDQALI